MKKTRMLTETLSESCSLCSGSVVVEMDGVWTFRACLRCGRVQESPGVMPLSVALFPARG